MIDNGINLVGNLTADPEFKVTSGGVAVVRRRPLPQAEEPDSAALMTALNS